MAVRRPAGSRHVTRRAFLAAAGTVTSVAATRREMLAIQTGTLLTTQRAAVSRAALLQPVSEIIGRTNG